MILQAAILQNGIVYTGKRHPDVIADMRSKGIVWNHTEIQGFVTDTGKFLNRMDALDHFIKSGQKTVSSSGLRMNVGLFSEDLY